MKSKRFVAVAVLLAFFASLLPACEPREEVESYLAVAPLVLQSGGREAVSVTLLKGEKPVTGNVLLTLLKGSDEVLTTRERISGKGVIHFRFEASIGHEFTNRLHPFMGPSARCTLPVAFLNCLV